MRSLSGSGVRYDQAMSSTPRSSSSAVQYSAVPLYGHIDVVVVGSSRSRRTSTLGMYHRGGSPVSNNTRRASCRPARPRPARPGSPSTMAGCRCGCTGHEGARRPPRPPRTRRPSPASRVARRRGAPRSVSSDTGSPLWAPRLRRPSLCRARHPPGSASARCHRWERGRRASRRRVAGSRSGSTASPRRRADAWYRRRRGPRSTRARARSSLPTRTRPCVVRSCRENNPISAEIPVSPAAGVTRE